MERINLRICATHDLVDVVKATKPSCVISISHPDQHFAHLNPPILAEVLGDSSFAIRQLVLPLYDTGASLIAQLPANRTFDLNPPTAADLNLAFTFAASFPMDRPVVVSGLRGLSLAPTIALALLARAYDGSPSHHLVSDILAQRPQSVFNRTLVELADERLGREGTLVDAVMSDPRVRENRRRAALMPTGK